MARVLPRAATPRWCGSGSPEGRACLRPVAGFSLIELMVVVALVAILLGFASPSLRAILANGEIAATTNSLVHSLQLARSEAVKRGVAMGLCTSNDPMDVDARCSDQVGYGSGWVVYVDDNANGSYESAGSEEIVHRQEAPNGAYTFAPSNLFAHRIWFDATGASVVPPDSPVSGQIGITHRSGDQQRVVRISANGRIATETPP